MSTASAIERFLESPSLADATRRAYRIDLEEFATAVHRVAEGGLALDPELVPEAP